MYRKAQKYLSEWRNRPTRKPLIIRGARQVGKTWLVRKLADQFENLVEVNFDKYPEKAQLFSSRDIKKCLQLLEIESGNDIVPGNTLLFLDEIQSAPELLPLLRYFYEEQPNLHIIAAGSLLEFLLADHDFSMPVGRVEYLHLGPMDLEEFLLALKQERLCHFLEAYGLKNEISEPIHISLINYLKLFWIVGGMPAAVAEFSTDDKLSGTIREQSLILQTYEDDFSKYRKRIYPQRLRKVFNGIPAMIGKKLKYVRLDPQERSRDLADSLDLLEMARVIYRIRHSAGNGIPLAAEAKSRDFKPLFLDIGLVSTSLGIGLPGLEMVPDLLMVNKGAIAEQFIGQHLLFSEPGYAKPQLFYWNREKKNSSAEVDYLVAHEDSVVPVEVKAGKAGTLKSLQLFVTEKKSPIALRFNTMQPSYKWLETGISGKEKISFLLISLPLYLVCQTRRLIAEGMTIINQKPSG